MSDLPDHEDDDDEDEEDALETTPETLPAFGFSLTGMDLFNPECIRAVNFIRNKEGTIIDVVYALMEKNVEFLAYELERFNCDEAYLTLMNDKGDRISTIILCDLELQHMELAPDEEESGDMVIHFSFNAKSFTQQIHNK